MVVSEKEREHKQRPLTTGVFTLNTLKDELTEEDNQALEPMDQADGKVAEAYDLGQRFTEMI